MERAGSCPRQRKHILGEYHLNFTKLYTQMALKSYFCSIFHKIYFYSVTMLQMSIIKHWHRWLWVNLSIFRFLGLNYLNI